MLSSKRLETVDGLRPPFSAHVHFRERGAPVQIRLAPALASSSRGLPGNHPWSLTRLIFRRWLDVVDHNRLNCVLLNLELKAELLLERGKKWCAAGVGIDVWLCGTIASFENRSPVFRRPMQAPFIFAAEVGFIDHGPVFRLRLRR